MKNKKTTIDRLVEMGMSKQTAAKVVSKRHRRRIFLGKLSDFKKRKGLLQAIKAEEAAEQLAKLIEENTK